MDEKIAADSGRQSWYFCIDLKSFYASVECVERGLDPLTARLVVADSRARREDDLSGRDPGAEKTRRQKPLPPV